MDEHTFKAIRNPTTAGAVILEDTATSSVTISADPLTADRVVTFPDTDGVVVIAVGGVSPVTVANGINGIACSITGSTLTVDGASLTSDIATLNSAITTLSGIVVALNSAVSSLTSSVVGLSGSKADHGTYGVSGGAGGSVSI